MSVTSLNVSKVTPNIGAVVHDINLADVDAPTLAQIEAELVTHKVLFFKDQHWSAEQQRAFAESFGELHTHPTFEADSKEKQLVVFSYNDNKKGNNDTWHSDVSFIETPVKMGILYALEIPAVGGDTLWLDTEAAYTALSEPLKQFLGGLKARHSFFSNLRPETIDQFVRDGAYRDAFLKLPPVAHPVVRTHPVSGHKSLFVNQAFTLGIEDLHPDESDALLQFLLRHLENPEFQMRWRWQKNTVAIWDNRCTQHLAVSDYFPAKRSVRRAAVLGDKPF